MKIIYVNPDTGKANLNQSLPVIANAYIKHEQNRVRADNARRARGTISLRVFDDNRRQVVNILRGCKDRFKDRLNRVSSRNIRSYFWVVDLMSRKV